MYILCSMQEQKAWILMKLTWSVWKASQLRVSHVKSSVSSNFSKELKLTITAFKMSEVNISNGGMATKGTTFIEHRLVSGYLWTLKGHGFINSAPKDGLKSGFPARHSCFHNCLHDFPFGVVYAWCFALLSLGIKHLSCYYRRFVPT